METKTQITVFYTPNCPYCHMVMDYFDEKNIEYTSIDLTKNPDKAQKMMAASGQTGVPVTIINKGDKEKVVVGFNQAEINSILDLKD